jgi:hypothetical protein
VIARRQKQNIAFANGTSCPEFTIWSVFAVKEKLNKQPKGDRRDVAPLEPVDAKDGPKMQALPTDRHRAPST